MNELNKLYKAMLLSWGGQIKDDGRIVFAIEGEEYPITIDEMNMYLPLSEVLESNCVNKVFFHPACENITSKETEVFKIIRKMTCMKLLETFRKYPVVLFKVAAGKEKRNWRQDVLDLIDPLKGVKKSVQEEVIKLFNQMTVEIGEDGLDNRFIHFKVAKGGGRSRGNGERSYYKTKPVFPFYSEVIKRLARAEGQSDNQTVTVNNHSVSVGALKIASHLFQSIIPGVTNPDDLEYESTTAIASRLISYIGCYSEVVVQMNRVQNHFRVDFDKLGIYSIDINWTEYLDNISDIYRQVPIMDYNSHNSQEEDAVVNRSNLSGLMQVSSSGGAANLNQNLQNRQQVVQSTAVGDYDTTVPPMEPGDRYIRTEIDYQQNRVVHHAVNTLNNSPVRYECSRMGNFMSRVETNVSMLQQQMAQMGLLNMGGLNNLNMGMPGMAMNGMGGVTNLGNGMFQLPNGMVVSAAQLGMGGTVSTAGSGGGTNYEVGPTVATW